MTVVARLTCSSKSAQELRLTKMPFSGTYLFLDAPIEDTVEYVKQCAVKARSSLIGATRIRDYVAGAIDRFQPQGAGSPTQSPMHSLVMPTICIAHAAS